MLKAATLPEYAPLIDDAIAWAKAQSNDRAQQIHDAMDKLAVDVGLEVLKIVPGRVSTEVDARLSFDTTATLARARRLIGLYEAAGIARERVLIKVAATWEGIRAAEALEREGIRCNLTLLFSFAQAVACAQAGVSLISPFVGRILDWHKAASGRDFSAEEDPGVLSVRRIYNYYKKFGYKTEVMGASFRNVGEITELAGSDLLTIAPSLLAELQATEGELPRKLDAEKAATMEIEKLSLDKVTFDSMHAANRMATDKLAEGIAGFAKALVTLEELLAARLTALEA